MNAQNDEIDFQTWTDFTLKYNINVKSSFGGDFGIRGLVSENEWKQFYLRPNYQFVISPYLQATCGMAFFYTSNNIVGDISEIRLFQQASVAWPDLSVVQLKHRIRFEERFFFYEEYTALGAKLNDHFTTRIRYQLEAETVDFNVFNQKIYFALAAEFFQTRNNDVEPFINNSRFLIAAGHRISQRMRYEIHYILQKSRILTADGLKASEHIFRLRFFWVSDRKNKNER